MDFPYAGTYTMDISGRSGTFCLDRFVYFNENLLTWTQATTDNPPPSPVQCIEVAWFADNDGDLFGNKNDFVLSLVKPAGYVLNDDDCDDTKSAVNPAHVEIEDGLDNNCNGVVDEGFGNPKALFVVGNTILSPSDQVIKDRITQAGFEVTVMSAAQTTTLAGDAMNLIFISATVNSADVAEKFTYLEVPVIVCEPNLFDDFKMMTGNATTLGTLTNQTQIKLSGAPHALAAGLSNGIKTVYTSLDKLSWGKPLSSAKIIARATTDTTQCTIFAYDNNALMTSINAPARRVGFFLNEDGAAKLTADGLALLDAAIRWTANYTTNVNITIGDALFLVGSANLTNADLFVKTRLEGLGFNVIPVAAASSQASDANGKELIVISSTVTSTDVGSKFTNAAVPLLNWEPALSDDLKMSSTGSVTSTNATKIMIMNTTHSMAAGLPPAQQVVVYNSASNLIYSSTLGSNAIKIACTGSSSGSLNNNITIYGYEKGVTMVGATAAERRVGFFLHDVGASVLTSNGWNLFDAAIRWLTEGLNTPPAFNVSGNITVNEDFTGTQTVFVNPLPVPPGEQNQVPAYSLSPTSVSFANVSFSTATGNVTFTSKPNEFGTQEFTITADDHMAKNNTYSKTFTLTVNPVNDAPAFNVSGNIIVLKNFAGTQSVTVIPEHVPYNEASQTVTYSLSPASVPFANVSLNASTGQVSFTSKPEQTGFQIFTLTANDGQAVNNTSSKEFFLAVNNPTSNALCFNCGGSQYIAVTGDTFKSDYYFSPGTLTYTNENIANFQNTFDDFIFKSERNATAFSYNIPVANGVYKVRLYFAETYFGATGGNPTGGAGSRVFHVNIEGTQVLSYFDIFGQAGGAEKAIMREFSNVAVSDGMMNIAFNAVINKAKISGICIVPDLNANHPPSFTLSGNVAEVKNFAGTRTVTVTPDPVYPGEESQVVTYSLNPPSVPFANISFNTTTGQVDITSVPDASGFQAFTITANDGQPVNNTVSKTFYLAVNETRSKAMCWNCGGPQYVSVAGDTFRSDFYFTSGAFTSTNNAIVDVLNTFDDFIYRSERNSASFGYNIPVPNGLYKVKLLFAETYFGATGGSASGGIGSRVFNVSLEGTQVLTNYDIFYKAGGAERAIVEEFDSLTITDGFINIAFTALVNKAKISGICVIPYTDNEPPSFSLSTSTLTLNEDFAGTQTVTVIPDPVPPSDSDDIVTYSLSPAGTGVASVSINPTTGTISISKLNNKNGSQVFSVIANDGQPFGTFTRTFTLNILPVNDPPTFTLNNNIVLAKNFSPPVSVQVTPDPVPTDEASQVVTYTLSPPTASFATISFNSSTGMVTFTSINNAYGSQQFTIFADDGQPVNNVASQTFTLTVNQLGPNDPRPKFINCGSATQYISLAGDTFKADNYYSTPTFTFTNNSIPDILNTGDDVIYRTERYAGTFSYNIPVINGLYDISLHFAELYYGATGGQPSNGGPGKRKFNVSLEGTQVLSNYDVWAAAGGAERAVIETFPNIAITDGQVNLTFTATLNNAKVNAISIRPVNTDCAGVQGGLAYLNECNICVGGTTGLPANSGKDCAGVCGGSAYLNDCNICVGGTTGLSANQGKDCAGVCGGTAYLNDCNICVGGTTGLSANQGKDCAGVCGGAAHFNSCSICVGGTTGLPENQGKDCAGVCGGSAFLDDCGICSGGTSGHVANSNKDVCGVCFGNGSSCTPPCVPNEVVSFTLMRAGTAGEIGPLTNGMTINLATIGSFSIRANTCNGQNVGSVKFILNGTPIRTESVAPYAINGDSPTGSYIAWNPSVGSKTLTATPYTGASGSGTAGVSETVTFTVINQANTTDCAGVVNGTAHLNSCGICVGGTTGLPENQGKDCAGVCGGTAYLNTCNMCVGGTTGLGANQGKDCAGVCNGTAFLDDCGICSGGTSGHAANSDKDVCGVCFGNGVCACPPLSIQSLTQVGLCTSGDIATITEGMIINLAVTPDFSIRINPCSTDVNSVKIYINGSLFRTESSLPFAINGDSPAGCFKKWYVGAIPYTITVIPYSGLSGSGTAGPEYTIHFRIVNQAAKMDESQTAENFTMEDVHIYPNPSNGQFTLECEVPRQTNLFIKVFNHLGQIVYSDEKTQYVGELKEQIMLDDQPAGMYYLQLNNGSNTLTSKVMVRD
ncbi:MAG TPA: malectin domain-containing carbohydrate-binding protein [Chitinophagales bacterium]|nr:malectin domain-containing carbohydrate-binding protein [Chitinophagales bacterium]